MNEFEDRLELALRGFLSEMRAVALSIDPRLGPLVDELESAVAAGGKRLRPQLAAWGYRAGGAQGDAPMVRGGAALGLLRTVAPVPGDVLGPSPTPRGPPP